MAAMWVDYAFVAYETCWYFNCDFDSDISELNIRKNKNRNYGNLTHYRVTLN